MLFRAMSAALLAAVALSGQEATPAATAPPVSGVTGERPYLVDVGTRVPLSMINSISTKNSAPGDRVYLETTFPIVIDGKIVIPAGSYVMGTITDTHRPGKVKGRGEFRLRFDSLTLPNGVTRDFRATVAGLDGRASETLDRKEGTIRSEGNKAGDAKTVGTTTIYGASGGGLAGAAAGAGIQGAGIGAAAGATAGLIGVLLTRGPDAVLAKGSSVDMVLDRPVYYAESELDFSPSPAKRGSKSANGSLPGKNNPQSSVPGGYPRRIP